MLVYLVVGQASYPWGPAAEALPLSPRTPPPTGAERVPTNGFGEWLRTLPTRPGRPAVHLYDGRLKGRQDVHDLVLDLDVGSVDLQQCADAVMRLRAEYLWASGRADEVCFGSTSGQALWWRDYALGQRTKVQGQQLVLGPQASPKADHDTFRRYLDVVFTYAGTRSLTKALQRVPPREVIPGDVWIQPGSPGHAVLVLDVARSADRIYLLLAQSYMPAQEVHVLRAPNGGPWFELLPGQGLRTPEWDFGPLDLHRFEDEPCRSARRLSRG